MAAAGVAGHNHHLYTSLDTASPTHAKSLDRDCYKQGCKDELCLQAVMTNPDQPQADVITLPRAVYSGCMQTHASTDNSKNATRYVSEKACTTSAAADRLWLPCNLYGTHNLRQCAAMANVS